MFTSIDKALVALVMALVFLANEWLGLTLNVSPERIEMIIALITPAMVWLIPNRSA